MATNIAEDVIYMVEGEIVGTIAAPNNSPGDSRSHSFDAWPATGRLAFCSLFGHELSDGSSVARE